MQKDKLLREANVPKPLLGHKAAGMSSKSWPDLSKLKERNMSRPAPCCHPWFTCMGSVCGGLVAVHLQQPWENSWDMTLVITRLKKRRTHGCISSWGEEKSVSL